MREREARLSGNRQRDARDRAAAGTRQQIEMTAVQSRDPIDDRKAETGTRCAVAAGTCGRRPRERLLQTLGFAGGNACAAIGASENATAAVSPGPDADGRGPVGQ